MHKQKESVCLWGETWDQQCKDMDRECKIYIYSHAKCAMKFNIKSTNKSAYTSLLYVFGAVFAHRDIDFNREHHE